MTSSATSSVTLGGLAAIGPGSVVMFVPVLPVLRAEFATGLEAVQATVSIPLVASLAAVAIVGPLSDRLGRRALLFAMLAIFTGASLLPFLFPSFWGVLGARVLIGASGTACFVLARAVAGDRFGDQAATAMGRLAAAAALAVLLCPLIGGVLGDAIGWRGLFAFQAAVGLGMAGAVFLWLPETARRRVQPGAPAEQGGAATLMRSASFWAWAALGACHFAVIFAFMTGAAHLAATMLHLPMWGYGAGLLLTTLSLMGGLAASSRLAGRVGGARFAFFGAMVALVAATGLLVALTWGGLPLTPVLLFGGAMVSSLGIGMATPAAQAGVVAVDPLLAGTASSVAGLVQMLLSAAATQATSMDFGRLDIGLAGMNAALLAVAVLAAAVAWARADADQGEMA